MPTAAPTRCTHPGCPDYAVRRGKCDTHYIPWRSPSANSQQLTSAERARFRKEVLRREPNCRYCGAPATDADHIIPVSEGGALTDTANGQGLCADCHEQKTKEEQARGRERARQARTQ